MLCKCVPFYDHCRTRTIWHSTATAFAYRDVELMVVDMSSGSSILSVKCSPKYTYSLRTQLFRLRHNKAYWPTQTRQPSVGKRAAHLGHTNDSFTHKFLHNRSVPLHRTMRKHKTWGRTIVGIPWREKMSSNISLGSAPFLDTEPINKSCKSENNNTYVGFICWERTGKPKLHVYNLAVILEI